MKRKYVFTGMIIIVLTLISCSNGNDMSEIITENENLMEENNNSFLEGVFVSEAHPTTGTASINSAKTELKFTNLMTDSGPLLEVWLSKLQTPTTTDTYMSLGLLKGTSGDYIYDLPNNIDFSKYNYVVIWCVEASVSFGYAVVK